MNVVGFEFRLGQEIVSSPKRPDVLWSPPSLLFHRYRRRFSEGTVVTHLYLAPRSRMNGDLLLCPVNAPMEWKRTAFLCFTLARRFNAKYSLFFPHTVCVCVCVIITTNSVPSGSILCLFFPMEARCFVSEV